MTLADVVESAIPAIIGLVLYFRTNWFVRPSGSPDADHSRLTQFKRIGIVLTAIGIAFLTIKTLQAR